MDRNNYQDVLALTKDEAHKAKVSLFLDDDIVPDPYYDNALFEPVFRMIQERCKLLIQDWNK